MTEKVDLRVKGEGEYPAEIKKLIAQHNGVIGKAEKYAGISLGLFARIRRGKEPFSDFIKTKVKAALEGKPLPAKSMNPQLMVIPETCPPTLAALIKHAGSKLGAARQLGTSEGTLYAVISGKRDMPPAWEVRAKAAMGVSVIAPLTAEKPPIAVSPDAPEFVLWDGKSKGTITLSQTGKNPGRKIKNAPQPIVDAVLKFGGITGVSKVVGTAIGTITGLAERKIPFSEKYQRKVFAAMHGLLPPAGPTMGEEFDKYTMSIAICFLKGANFDRISEIADILLAKMVFRRNTKAGWIIIYRMADEDLPKFKRLALRDAEEIVCP